MSLSGKKAARISIGLALVALLLGCIDSDEARAQAPLPPDQVFRYEITANADEILLDFDVNDGGYLYRDKFGFEVTSAGVSLDTTRFPSGEMHTDEFFGTQEIYRERFQIALPYVRTAAVDTAEIEIRLQGCDDNIGLCYPPQRWPATVALPPGPIAGIVATGTAASSIFAGTQSDEPLPIEQAFVPNPRFDSANELTVSWQIEPGYYLYRDQFTFEADGGIQFGGARMPMGTAITDQNFGDVEVYYNSVDIVVPFARAHPDEQFLSITAGYQGCKDESICYPPAGQVFELTLPPTSDFASGSSVASATQPIMVSEQDAMAELVSNGALIAVLGTFFLAGLGLSLTPCVYPMVPILSSIIAGQSNASTGRSFMLSVSYVLGMAVTYSAAGAITALAGSQVQAVFQQPWIIVSVAVLFGIMALAMFGLFELQMPAAIQSRLTAMADKRQNGTFFGTAMVGALSALIVTTCVAPPLIGALIAIGQSGDVARGSLALFVLSLGMGVPLLLIGASAGRLLPKVGPWMNTIKAAFGVVMVGMAIWMLDRILPGTVTLLLWAVLVFLTGVFLGAFDALPAEAKPMRRLAKGIGVLACLYGALMLIGWVLGGNNPLRPVPTLSGLLGQPAAAQQGIEFIDVETIAELDALLASASNESQPVFVEFTADWCPACKEMEEYTFPDAGVVAALGSFVSIRIDVTENNDDDQALLQRFQSYGPPTMAFFDRSGEELDPYRLYGYVPADEFSEHVSAVAAL